MTAMATAPPAAAASAAAGPTGQVIGDLNDPEYINWYKANRTLNVTTDVLRPVCVTQMQSFHNSLLTKHTSAACGKCTSKNIKPGTVPISCPSNVCNKWITDIMSERTKTNTRLNWQNSDFSLWQSEPWQLAKIYMDKGQDKQSPKCHNMTCF